MTIGNEEATQAGYHAGRAAVMHAMVIGLLATQRLSDQEVEAFFKTMRGALEEVVTNTGRVQVLLRGVGFEEPASDKIIGAFREAVELQLRLVETEIPGNSAHCG